MLLELIGINGYSKLTTRQREGEQNSKQGCSEFIFFH